MSDLVGNPEDRFSHNEDSYIHLGTDADHIYWLGGLDALSNNEWFWSKSAERLKVRFNRIMIKY